MRRLWPFLDGALLESDREAVVAHLEMCANCTSHFDFGRAFLDAVAAAKPHLAENDGLRRRIVNALAGAGFAGNPSDIQ